MEGFLNFIKESPTAFHAARNIKNVLINNGYIELNESNKWELLPNGKYFIKRNSSSILAFCLPNEITNISYNITAAHLDSPTFKLKPNFKIDGKYIKLNTEVYGGPIYNTWMDRPLNIAGRLIVKDEKGFHEEIVSFDDAVCMIPNCSIHYYHELNKGVALNPQIDLLPLLTTDKDYDLLEALAKKYNINKEDIISHDLYLSLLDRGMLVGAKKEFIMAPQIDNLECSYALLKSLLNSNPKNNSINVMVLFDNEEIGSRTRQGAGSMLLHDTLERISLTLGFSYLEHKSFLASSFIISADNAQGYHPNYPQKYDPTNASYMNEGIVIKNAARGSYTTDGLSLAYFEEICKRSNSKYQKNTNRSDVLGGSTLGAISLMNVSIPSVDIGLPQIAMHSAYETAGRYDLEDLIKAITLFYQTHLDIEYDSKFNF